MKSLALVCSVWHHYILCNGTEYEYKVISILVTRACMFTLKSHSCYVYQIIPMDTRVLLLVSSALRASVPSCSSHEVTELSALIRSITVHTIPVGNWKVLTGSDNTEYNIIQNII